jgi:hypothetical protein
MSGSSDKAGKQARADEQARMAAISRTQGAINGVFNDPRRAKDIGDFVGATREFYTQDLDKQKGQSDRQLKFALARSGQTGGSTQVDRQSELGRDYQQGLLQVDRKARGAGAELESADQDARARLISLATSGLDATTAAQQAAASMRSSLEAGKSASQAQGIGDAFGSLGKYFQNSQDAAVRRRADQQAFGLYQPNANFNYGGGP